MTPDELLGRLTATFPGESLRPCAGAPGEGIVVAERAALTDVLRALRDDPAFAFEMLTDLTVVDYLGRTPRFEVIYLLNSLSKTHRLQVKVPVPEDDATVPSVATLWKSALWAEREAWDQFGIRFVGHPDLRRLLNPPEFVGHPLRKDYPVNRRQVVVPERDPIAEPWFPHMRRS